MDNLEKALDEILTFDTGNEMLYREILERVEIYRNSQKRCNSLVIWLKYLPFVICLKIKSTGKGTEYYTEILEIEFIA